MIRRRLQIWSTAAAFLMCATAPAAAMPGSSGTFSDQQLAALTDAINKKNAEKSAMPAGWTDQDTPYPYIALDQPVREVLTEFGRNLGLPVIVSEAIDGVVSIGSPNLTPQAFMRELSRKAGLQWYFDGVSLHVVRAEESRSRLVDLGSTSLAVVRKAVTDLGLADQRFPIRQAGRTGLAIIAGPSPYVETVENVVRALGGRDVVTALASGAEQSGFNSPGALPRVYRGATR